MKQALLVMILMLAGCDSLWDSMDPGFGDSHDVLESTLDGCGPGELAGGVNPTSGSGLTPLDLQPPTLVLADRIQTDHRSRPEILCEEGHNVIPQTVLHLSAKIIEESEGTEVGYDWSVDQPEGSVSIFHPSNRSETPSFEVNVAGRYVFYLQILEPAGPAAPVSEFEVLVMPNEAIHIELLWSTPEDTDETDTGPQAGSDLDLHFLHPWASGPDIDGDSQPDGWFDSVFDTFWFNAHPNWGSYEPTVNDDPGLDRDDTDGGGPENINLDIPEDGATYRVGVHYWNDHGYGEALATVRVYIWGYLVFELPRVTLLDKDMWEVCTIEWPSGDVHPILALDGDFKVTSHYKNPYFFQE